MRSTSFATQGALCTSSWSKLLSVSRGRRSPSPSLLACHACVLELAVPRYVADMAMFDLRAHPLHAARGFVLVPPDERGCRKTCGVDTHGLTPVALAKEVFMYLEGCMPSNSLQGWHSPTPIKAWSSATF